VGNAGRNMKAVPGVRYLLPGPTRTARALVGGASETEGPCRSLAANSCAPTHDGTRMRFPPCRTEPAVILAGLCEQGVTPNAQANSAARCCPIARQAAGSRMQVNDHIVEPGDVVFRHACELGFEDRVETARLALYVRPLTALDQEQEPTASGGEAGSGGGLE
jgi:hypothetical protein